jgi:hypothetical protein
MGASSQSHSGHSPLPYQRSHIPGTGSLSETAYSLRLDDEGAGGSSTRRPMLVRRETLLGAASGARIREIAELAVSR